MNLRDIVAIDQHAHNLVKPEAAEAVPYVSAFTEGSDPELLSRHARQTLFFRRSLREIAQLLECDPAEDAIAARQQELGTENLAASCFDAAHLEAVFLDNVALAYVSGGSHVLRDRCSSAPHLRR